MGNKNTLDELQAPNLNEWKQKQKHVANIWYHSRRPNIEMQEYKMAIRNQKDIDMFHRVYNLRKYHDILVASLYYLFHGATQSSYFSMFLERIPLRINEMGVVRFPQVLHLYYNTFVGFYILSKFINCYFKVSGRMVGMNIDGVVKVWLNESFDRFSVRSIGYNENKMVTEIIALLTQHTQINSQTNIMLKEINQSKTFKEIIAYIHNLAKKLSIKSIPSKLPSQYISFPRKSKYVSVDNYDAQHIFNKKSSLKQLKIVKTTRKNRANSADKQNSIEMERKLQTSISKKQIHNQSSIYIKKNKDQTLEDTYNQSRSIYNSHRGSPKKFYQNPNETATLPHTVKLNSTLTAQLPSYQQKDKKISENNNFFKQLRMVASEMQQSRHTQQTQIQQQNQYIKDQNQILQQFGLENIVENYRKSINNNFVNQQNKPQVNKIQQNSSKSSSRSPQILKNIPITLDHHLNNQAFLKRKTLNNNMFQHHIHLNSTYNTFRPSVKAPTYQIKMHQIKKNHLQNTKNSFQIPANHMSTMHYPKCHINRSAGNYQFDNNNKIKINVWKQAQTYSNGFRCSYK